MLIGLSYCIIIYVINSQLFITCHRLRVAEFFSPKELATNSPVFCSTIKARASFSCLFPANSDLFGIGYMGPNTSR
jgi:hypothetical protein